MSDSLIIWNKTQYASNALTNAFGRNNVVMDLNDYKASKSHVENYDCIIVLCELDWSTDNEKVQRHQLSGIELVKKLRRENNCITPVLFVSFLSIESILNSDREILTSIGHDFLQLPATPNDFRTAILNQFGENGSIRKLSEMELTDIRSFYCSKEGILIHELHQLNSFTNITITLQNHDSIYTDLKKTIQRIYEVFLLNSSNAVLTFQSKFPTLDKDNINIVVNYIKHLGDDLLIKYGENSKETNSKDTAINQYRWEVLLLDDEIDEQHNLINTMHSKNINVICVKNALDAKSILLEDWSSNNKIMVVIADYRLYENCNGVKRHQKIQGYQFLKEIASSDHLVRLVAFSGLQRKFLFNSFKHFNIRTDIKSKTDYLSSEQTRQIFCDEIIEIAEENLEAIEEMPSKCAGFKNSMEGAYKAFRMHPDYYKMENNVSITAKEYILEIKQQIADGYENDIRIGAIDNIKSPLAKKNKDPEAYFKRFSNYLIARRIALWLYASNKKGEIPNIDSRKIAEIITNKEYSTDAYRQIISTNLGLSLDDFPKNITIEERRWLQYDMQINIFRDINLIEPVFKEIERYFKEYITTINKLKEDIISKRFSLIYDYKKTNYSIDFSNEYTPKIKTATDVRVLFLIIANHIKDEQTNFKQFKPFVSKIRMALFKNQDNAIYLKNLFQFFNNFYRILNKEQTILTNIAGKIKDKSDFANYSKSSINNVFEKVYAYLKIKELPNPESDSADVYLVYTYGKEVVRKFSENILEDKSGFFYKIVKEINKENILISRSFDENHKNKKETKKNPNYDDNDDFMIFSI